MDEYFETSIDVFSLLFRNKTKILFCILLCLGISIGYYLVKSKTYKTQFEIAIEPAYFKSKLVEDILPDTSYSGELSSQRETIFKKALTDNFYDYLAKKYNQIKVSYTHPSYQIKRQEFVSSIQYYQSGTGFKISVINSSPIIAYHISNDIVKRSLNSFKFERLSKLKKAKNVIQLQLEEVSEAIKNSKEINNTDTLKKELSQVRSKISAFNGRFTSQHPIVKNLLSKETLLKKRLDEQENIKSNSKKTLYSESPDPGGDSNKNIYADLAKKLSDIRLLLSIEDSKSGFTYFSVPLAPRIPETPFSPKLMIYVGIGGIIGIILSLLAVVISEMKVQGKQEVSIEEILKIPVLAELPFLEDKTKQ
jgi:LPS O-antigen subunit length determinant protein (WzzB/FepE family)